MSVELIYPQFYIVISLDMHILILVCIHFITQVNNKRSVLKLVLRCDKR